MDGDVGPIAAAAVNPICLWCEGGFDIRKGGGAPQRFCQPKCRDAFHSAGRRWAEMAVLSGVITVGDLRNGSVTPCTLAGREEGTSDYPGIASDENALSAADRASVQRCSSNCRSRQTAFSTSAGSTGSIQIRCRMPEPLVMLWRS